MSERTSALVEISRIAAAADAEIDRLTKGIGAVTVAAIERYSVARPDGTRRITSRGRRRIMAAVDAELAKVYGKKKGQTDSPMYRAVAAASTAAYVAGARRISNDARRRLRSEPELLAILTGEKQV